LQLAKRQIRFDVERHDLETDLLPPTRKNAPLNLRRLRVSLRPPMLPRTPRHENIIHAWCAPRDSLPCRQRQGKKNQSVDRCLVVIKSIPSSLGKYESTRTTSREDSLPVLSDFAANIGRLFRHGRNEWLGLATRQSAAADCTSNPIVNSPSPEYPLLRVRRRQRIESQAAVS